MKHPSLANAARGLSALVAILGLIVMVPVLLVAMIGNPIPHPWSWTQPLTDQAILGILACFAWLFWAQFAACVVIELVAEIRLAAGRPADWLSRAPGTWRGQQAFARTLVQAVVALGVTSSAVTIAPVWMPHAAATTGQQTDESQQPVSDRDHSQHVVQPSAASEQVPAVRVEVRRGDTLWSIAESYLGAGERWREIATLNDGRIMADGQRFMDADRIRPGWVLLVPKMGPDRRADAVAVEQGDTLWGIAQYEYGVGADWPAIYHANRTRIHDPNLIYPGERLTVPRPAHHSTDRPVRQPQPQTGDREARNRGKRAEADSPPPEPRDWAPPSATRHETEPAQHPAQAQDRVDGEVDSWLHGTLARTLAGGGMLLAGCLAAAYAARRGAQFRVRRSGRTIPPTPPELASVERDIRTAGPTGGEAVAFLDRALRHLGSNATVVPDVVAARLSEESLELVLRRPLEIAPVGWEIMDGGNRWRLPRTHVLSESTGAAPYPTLVTLGLDSHGDTWLVDLEATGRVQLQGPDEVCDDVIRFLAAELATNRWSDVVKVKVAGIEPSLVHLNPGRLELMHGTDLDQAEEKAGRVIAAQREAGLDVLTGRQSVDSGDVWNPLVVMAATSSSLSESDVAALMKARGGLRCATALVLAGEAATRSLNISVDREGCCTIPWAGRIQVNRLSADDARALGAAFAGVAKLDDEPMPVGPLAASGPVAGLADEAGALLAEHTRARAPDGGLSASLLPEPSAVYVRAAATTDDDLRVLAPMVPASAKAAVTTADPHLDEDLAEWLDRAVVRPELRLLGPIELRVDRPIPEAARGRVAYLTEVAAYLFCHSGGVTSTRLADVFGVQANTIHKRIQELREWLGVDPATGAQRLPEAKLSEPGTVRGIGNYTLTGILADLDLFRRLRVRGQARGADGIDDLIAALDLVTGAPFDQQRPNGYGWLATDAYDHHLTAGIVDVAHIVATSALAIGDGERAAWAATTAIQVAPFEDKPRLDYAAALETMGHGAEAQEYLDREVLNRSDDDFAPPDPTPRVGQVLSRRGRTLVRPSFRPGNDHQ